MVELSDWTRGVLLLGQTGAGVYVPVLIDADGNINILLRGVDALGVVRTARVDNLGQLYAVLRGAGGIDVYVDAYGNLSALVNGETETGDMRTLRTDIDGRLIMVPRGASGNYMLVDASGFLTTILKGVDGGGALRTLLVDASGQAIMVPRGASGNYLDVDASGFLTAVLKGIRDGTLTTIGVDANGRIESFLVDAEDSWGKTVVTGNAGLAAKLGDLQNWDYRGQVYYQTDWSAGVAPWLKYPYGAGAAIEIDPTMCLSGGYSLKLTAGSNSTYNAYVTALIQRPPSGRVGCEIVWSVESTTGYMMIELQLYIAGVVYLARLRHSYVNNRIEYYTSAGAWAYYTNPYFLSQKEAFNRLKLVVDVTNKQYVRCLYGQIEQSMAGLGLYAAGTGFLNAMYVRLENTGRSGYNDIVYLDRVILTSGEPA